MDPDANLQEQQRIIIWQAESPIQTPSDRRYRRERLAELRHALLDWLRRGGFAPEWHKAPLAAEYRYFRRYQIGE